MIRVDLITGFLGAGKTTFLLRYARYLMAQGLKIGILVYDHGAVNVDMSLLGELRGEQCELEMLSGGCDADCHRRRFRTRLISMAMSGYDRVVIEPSGVFDMDEFFDTLQESPLDRQYEPGSVITVADAREWGPLSDEENFFLGSQAACAGCILLSKTQLAGPGAAEKALDCIRQAEASIGVEDKPEGRAVMKAWDELMDEDFRRISEAGYRNPGYVKKITGDSSFQSLSYLDLPLSPEELREKTETLFRDSRYGRILRVKGTVVDGERCYRLNATAREQKLEETGETRGAVTVIGTGLNEREIALLLTGKIPMLHLLD